MSLMAINAITEYVLGGIRPGGDCVGCSPRTSCCPKPENMWKTRHLQRYHAFFQILDSICKETHLEKL